LTALPEDIPGLYIGFPSIHHDRMKSSIQLAALLLVATAARVSALDVYLIRHAETMGNVTLDYSETNQCTFSPKGLTQVAGITEKLKDLSFDNVLVSPTWRTRQTILPYLTAHKVTAEICPEIEECCCDCRGDTAPASNIPLGEKIVISEGEAPYFKLRDTNTIFRFAPATEEEAVAQIQRAGDLIRSRFGGSGKSILIVTHSCTGGRFIENLLGLKPDGRFGPGNAALTHLRQEADGSFRLVMLNDAPFQPQYSWTVSGADLPFPGRPLTFTLAANYVMPSGGESSRVAWQLLNAQRHVVQIGSETIASDTRDANHVLDLTVETQGARFGDVWTLDSSLYSDTNRIRQWTYDFLFPSYESLAGPWRIHSGDDPAWSAPEWSDEAWATTLVPRGWEKDALPAYDGTAWYRLHFSLPPEALLHWSNAPLGVLMGAIDDADETFLNGRKIGATGEFPPAKVTAWDKPRIYEFDRSLLAETNVLAVRVSDWMGGGGIWKGPVAVGPASELKTAARLGP
jgi:broad specificity phosphatase PhoE